MSVKIILRILLLCLVFIQGTGVAGALSLTGSYHTAGYATDVAVSGSYAYVIDGDNGLDIIDISNPAKPTLAGKYYTGRHMWSVVVSGSYAYIIDGDNGLDIIDISNPTKPTLAGSYYTGRYARGLAVSGSYAYVANDDDLVIVDISNPTRPTLAGSYNITGDVLSVAVSGRYAYVAVRDNGLAIVDISNPARPMLVGSYHTEGYAVHIAVSSSYAYVIDSINGLVIVDISNPARPTRAGSYNTRGKPWNVAVSGNYAYVTDYTNGLFIIDISNPVAPTLAGRYDTAFVTGVAVSGNYAYVADGTNGLVIIGAYGSISVSSSPSGAKVYLDGAYKGTTPYTITSVLAGSHAIKLTKSGYTDETKTITVLPEKPVQISETLNHVNDNIVILISFVLLAGIIFIIVNRHSRKKSNKSSKDNILPDISKSTQASVEETPIITAPTRTQIGKENINIITGKKTLHKTNLQLLGIVHSIILIFVVFETVKIILYNNLGYNQSFYIGSIMVMIFYSVTVTIIVYYIFENSKLSTELSNFAILLGYIFGYIGGYLLSIDPFGGILSVLTIPGELLPSHYLLQFANIILIASVFQLPSLANIYIINKYGKYPTRAPVNSNIPINKTAPELTKKELINNNTNPIKTKPPVSSIISENTVQIKTAFGYKGATIIFKLKIENNTSNPISDIKVYPYVPDVFLLKEKDKSISLIEPNSSQTVTFEIRPTGECGECNVSGRVNYYDMVSRKRVDVELEPKSLSIVCPMLRGKEISENEWDDVVSNLVKTEESTREIDMPAGSLFTIVSRIVKDMHMYMQKPEITENQKLFNGVARFYAEGVKGLKYAAQVEVIGGAKKSKLILKTWAEKEEALTGFYHGVLDEIEKRVNVKEYIQDSIVQQYNIHYGDKIGTQVKDSVVQRSNIGAGEKRKCSNCGREVNANEKFCLECGEKLGV